MCKTSCRCCESLQGTIASRRWCHTCSVVGMNVWATFETVLPPLSAALFTAFLVRGYLKKHRKAEENAKLAAEEGSLFSHGAPSLHPQIDESRCIGCAACVAACPECDVLGILGGKATILKQYKCIG